MNQASSAASDRNLQTSDITTNNASSTKHGFLPKLDNTATHFIDMTGSQRALLWSDLPNGAVVQVVPVTSATKLTGTTAIPHDDTIPQITEGDEYMTVSITPKSTTNILVIQAGIFLSNSNANMSLTVALFQDSTANALAVANSFQTVAAAETQVPLNYSMAAGTTSSTTFRIRAGSPTGATTTFNGDGGNRFYGTAPKSSLIVWEYKA